MFICNLTEQTINFFDWKSLKKISWNFKSIFSIIQQKYNKIDNLYIWYYWNLEYNFNKNILIFVPRFKKLYEINKNFAKKIWIKKLLVYLNAYQLSDLKINNEHSSYEIYWNINHQQYSLYINNFNDLIKTTFLHSTTKDKENGMYISYSYVPFIWWHYPKDNVIENSWIGVDINKKIAIEKSLSENIERASASEFLYNDSNLLKITFKSLPKYNQQTINLYRNEYDIPNTIKGVELQWLTTKKSIFLPNFLIFYPTKETYTYNTCSSWMATHLTLENAILWWIFELIERDSFIFSWLSRSKKIYQIDNSYVSKLWIPLNSDFNFTFFLLDSLVPIPTVLAIMEKKGKKCISLWTDFMLEKAILKSYQEGINSKPLFKSKEISNSNSEVMQHIYYYLNPKHWNNLEWLNNSHILKIKNLQSNISNYDSLISRCQHNNINLFFYEFKNELNNIFKRKTVRVFSPELLPIYFWKKIPNFILNNKRIKSLDIINTDLHPLG